MAVPLRQHLTCHLQGYVEAGRRQIANVAELQPFRLSGSLVRPESWNNCRNLKMAILNRDTLDTDVRTTVES